jgi:hypothetical protein
LLVIKSNFLTILILTGMSIILKEQIIGSIKPRWPKKRVVKWLEWGAVPAILGLWIPDWSGEYIKMLSNSHDSYISYLVFPPVITFIGAVILFKGCTEGIKDMGWHYKGALWSGWIAIAFAGLSLIWNFLIQQNPVIFSALTILSIGLAAFFASGILWLTILKVAEISVESRTSRTSNIILVLGITALISGAVSVILIYFQHPLFVFFLRLTVVLFTIVFGFCRYGVYCYKTQKSIGAGFTSPPDEQFWI